MVCARPLPGGGAGFWAAPMEPVSIARAIVEAAQPGNRDRLLDLGFARASQFTWAATAAQTLDVYREVAAKRKARKS